MSTLCPRCAHRMAHLSLAGHDGRGQRVVEVEHCSACRLVWFDALESVQLSGLGWVELLRRLDEGGGLALAPPQHAAPACPRCTAPLKEVQNRSRYGAFAMLECPSGHGHLHTHTGLLAERGLVRGLLPPEREAIRQRRQLFCCLNCGAPAQPEAERCAYCTSPLVVIDLPRLRHALARDPHCPAPSPRPQGEPLAWPCLGCGAPIDPQRDAQCAQCGDPAAAPELAQLAPLLARVEAELADAESARLLHAARTRPVRLERPPRAPSWRDTQLARLARFFRSDK